MRKAMRAAVKYIQRRIAEEFGFVLWVPEYKAMHAALNFEDAREWVLAYPEDAKMFLYHRGKLVIKSYL